MNYAGMTIEQLEAEQAKLHADMKTIKARKKEVAAALDKLHAVREAETVMQNVSPEARKHLVHMIASNGIASGEAVGTPGA